MLLFVRTHLGVGTNQRDEISGASYQAVLDSPAQRGNEMNNQVKTSGDSKGMVIESRAHRLTDEVSQALMARRSAHLDMVAVEREN